MKIIGGANCLKFDNVPEDLFDMETLMEELPEYGVLANEEMS